MGVGVGELLLLPVLLIGRFLVEVAAVIVGLIAWERWFKRR
jgi:hypothetical protein